ncbi:MAG: methyltransferase domain-containing protein, partial [Vampirovibrio sp.]|nr:methyltransferase domain-containing protein [Vampirovibrio sp.]
YDGGRQPLTTLAWPLSSAEARTMERLPLTFIRCIDCGHVYNKDFDYAKVPYSDKPNLMFNKGELWQEHLSLIRDRILEHLPENPTVIEIGCGDGHLLKSLADAAPGGRYIGFDPNSAIDTYHGKIEAYPCLFKPEQHMAEYKPDLIISRHVLEHLMNPLGFVQSLSFATAWHRLNTRLFIEVPCIDRVFDTGRTIDFFYEHNSHFTTESLTRLMSRCGSNADFVDRGYDEEVVFAMAKLGSNPEQVENVNQALGFHEQAAKVDSTVRDQLSELYESGQIVAVWGGTGKASAFINRYHVDAERFPIVVDSDPDKAGTFVPGMGQEIHTPDILLNRPVDTIVIATQWRARDIVLEMDRSGIRVSNVLLEYQGKLVDFYGDPHPYKGLQTIRDQLTETT